VDIGMSLQRNLGTLYDHARSVIAAHRVKGDRDAFAHLALPLNEALGSGRFGRRFRHLASVIITARLAEVVRTLELAAIRAFCIGRRFERVM
jgi:hypothetical protein